MCLARVYACARVCAFSMCVESCAMILDLERYKLNCCGSICNVYMCMFISSACGYTACRVGALPPVRRVAWWADKGSLHCMAKQVSARCIRMFHSGRRHGFLRKSAKFPARRRVRPTEARRTEAINKLPSVCGVSPIHSRHSGSRQNTI